MNLITVGMYTSSRPYSNVSTITSTLLQLCIIMCISEETHQRRKLLMRNLQPPPFTTHMKEDLQNGKWLTDEHICLAQRLLRAHAVFLHEWPAMHSPCKQRAVR